MAQRRHTLSTALFATTAMLVAGTASAAQECQVVRIKAAEAVAGLEAEATGIRVVAGDTAHAIDGAVLQAGTWRVTQAQFDQVKASVSLLSDEQRRAATLVQTRNGRDMVVDPLHFLLDGEAASRACGSLVAREREIVPADDAQRAGGGAAGPATPEQCKSAGNTWIRGGTRYQVPVLFNSRGVHCY